MIYTGENEYPVYLGENEIPAIYCGEELIYPVNLGTLTGITIENLAWVKDVPYSGGTADKDNCSYKVVGHYDSGKNRTVTKDATVTGSISVSASTADTRVDVGQLTLTAAYEGFTASGTVEAYQEPPYLYFRITNRTSSDGTISLLKSGTTHNIVLRYRTNGGAWSSDATYSSDSTFTLPANGYVEFDGPNNPYFNDSSDKFWRFDVNVQYDVSGDLFSLVSARTVTHTDEFRYVLRSQQNLINASGLTMVADVLQSWCFGHAFNGCTNMLTAPVVQKDTTVLADYAYRGTFFGCSSLVTPPALPATALAQYCYYGMFQNCSSLTTSPDLPAETLPASCYMEMFNYCSSLNYVKCLARSGIYTTNSTFSWLNRVASTGTFVRYQNITWPINGSGIPKNWTIVDNT